MLRTLSLLADAVPAGDVISPWANLTATGAIIALLVWVVTRAFPSIIERYDETLERQDVAQVEARNHFERILMRVEDNAKERDAMRLAATKDGHDAARQLAQQIGQNTTAVERLSDRMNSTVRV